MREPRCDAGSVLALVLLVSSTLVVVGAAFLQIAGACSRTASRARDAEALLRVAETGARAVKRWFDAPSSGAPSDPGGVAHLFLDRFDLRDPSLFDRTRRAIDHDGDPLTPQRSADGSPGLELYRQGRTDLFHPPFRGDAVLALMGSEQAPDLVLEDVPGTVDLLDRLNAELFPDQTAGRIVRLALHGPPMAGPRRLGIGTVTVTAARYERMAWAAGIPVVAVGAAATAEVTVRVGLAEIPYRQPRGPLSACNDITVRGPLRAAWGRVMAGGTITLAGTRAGLDAEVASGYPYTSLSRRLEGAVHAAWIFGPARMVEDPWLKVMAGGDLAGWGSLPDQPFPYDPGGSPDADHSNLHQRVTGLGCPMYGHDDWVSLATGALPGERSTRYFAFDSASGLFRENAAGPARSVREWTNGQQGFFFFDTADGLPPSGSNLTPPVRIEGGDWSFAGYLHLNAASFACIGARGTPRVILSPGEPFDDADGDLAHDAGEAFLNLRYATTVGTGATTDWMMQDAVASQSASAVSGRGEVYTSQTTLGRDGRGLPIPAEVNVFGILYNAGAIVVDGPAVHFGSLVAGGSIVQEAAGGGSAAIYFDERIAAGTWPPPEIAMPRTRVTFWQVGR